MTKVGMTKQCEKREKGRSSAPEHEELQVQDEQGGRRVQPNQTVIDEAQEALAGVHDKPLVEKSKARWDNRALL